MSWVERHLVKEALAELADVSYQERVWLGRAEGQVGSVTEATSQLFDDSGLGDALEMDGAPAFEDEIDELLRSLDAALRPVVGESRPPAEVLSDARMGAVRGLAASALFGIIRFEAKESRTRG